MYSKQCSGFQRSLPERGSSYLSSSRLLEYGPPQKYSMSARNACWIHAYKRGVGFFLLLSWL